ncbi:MAG: hypothetical protein WKF72_09400 [Nocardioidaceae bacterium]
MRPPPATDFDAFAVRHLRRLAQVADLLTGDRVEADRVVVDAFIVMSRTWPSRVDSQAQLRAARRSLAVSARRSHRRRGSTGQEAALVLADEFGAAAATPEGADAVWQAVLDLAPRDRMVLVWHLFEQLPDSAVAQAVGAPALVVGRRVRRGLDQVGMTVGPTTEDEIAGRRDAGGRDQVAAQVAACLEQHHRGEVDVEPLLARIRTGTAGISPRRSRTRPALLAGAAAVLVLASVVAVRWWPDQPDARAALPTLPSFPVAPPGTRLVGYGDVAVAVPTRWSRGLVGCDDEASGTVILPDSRSQPGVRQCERDDAPPIVAFEETNVVRADVLGVTAPGSIIDGQRVLRTDVYVLRGRYEQSLVVPEERLVLRVSAADRATVTRIIESVRSVPRGFSVVPICRGEQMSDATDLLVEAGLRPVIKQASVLSSRLATPPVTYQSIPAGAVVPTGSDVGLLSLLQ